MERIDPSLTSTAVFIRRGQVGSPERRALTRTGLAIGMVFLGGYFRVPLYLVEALLAWMLAYRASKGNAERLWQWQPVNWDELVWFPVPGLERHLRALTSQNPEAAQAAQALLKESFRQGSAATDTIKK